MEDQLEGLARKYTQALNSMKEIKSQLTDVVIKYLLNNSSELSRCTQLALSEGLSMPQSTIRRLLIDLEEEGVLESSDVGQAKPYTVSKLGYALDRGYVSFTRDEVREVLRPRESTDEEFQYFVITGGISGNKDGRRVWRYLTPGGEKMARSFMARLSGYLPEDPTTRAVDIAFTEDEKRELRFMHPEMYLFAKLFRSPQESFWPVFPVTMEAGDLTPEQARDLIKQSLQDRLERGGKFLMTLAKMLEEDGYSGLLVREPIHKSDYMEGGKEYPIDYRFRKEYVYTATYLLRQGTLIGEKIGLNADELERLRLLCDSLDEATENEYEGAEEDGPILEP